MTRKRYLSVVVLLILMVLAIVLEPAGAETTNCTPITTSMLPYTINTQGIYCFTGHLSTNIASGKAITIATNNVVIDLNGYKLGGQSAGPGTQAIGIYANQRQNITVRNGTVRGFLKAIVLNDSSPYTTSQGHLIEDIRADMNTHTGIEVSGRGVVVRNNHVVDTGPNAPPGNAYGVVVQGPGAKVLGNNIFETVETGSTGNSVGVKVNEGPGSVIEDNRIGNETMGSGTSTGVEVNGSTDVVVVNNRIAKMTIGVNYVGASTGSYRDNLLTGVTKSYIGGTEITRGSISTCGMTISQPGSYYVTQNLSATGTCLEVTANDVTIDLNGFTLTGDGSSVLYGIYINNVSNVEVRNGTVRNFGKGIWANYSGTATKSNRVIGVRAVANAYGIYLASVSNLVKDCAAADSTDPLAYGIYAGYGSAVINNTAYNNQGSGIYAYIGSNLINNTAYNNHGDGIIADNGSTVINNTAYNNQGAGIYAYIGCTMTNNTAYNNQSDGIYADNGCTVTNNTTYNNNAGANINYGGIRVHQGCIVKNNTLRNNSQNNIYVDGTDNAIERNLVTLSGNGIFFNTGQNFYANNRASGNGTNYRPNSDDTDGGGNVEF
jgi:parallel beta-helix repeat protein